MKYVGFQLGVRWFLAVALALPGASLSVGAGTRPPAPLSPDEFGYRAFDQNDVECEFDFVDIQVGGTALNFTASGIEPALDDGGAIVALSEPFEFYGETLSSLVVSSNGYVAVAASLSSEDGGDFSNDAVLPAIPDNVVGVPARVLPYHDELSGFESGGVAYQQHFVECPRPSEALGTEACTIVQWTDWAELGGGNPFDAQVVLYHLSFEVALQLRPGTSTLASGTMGIQNRIATSGLQYRPDEPVSDDTAICLFEPRFPPGGMQADVVVSNADTVEIATPGQPVTYEIGVLNRGPSPLLGASVTDLVPASLVGCSWSCVSSVGSTCTASGAGDLVDTVDLDPGGWADYLLTCDTAPLADAVANTVFVTLPAGVTDPQPGDNSATDFNLVGAGSLPPTLLLDRTATEVVLAWGSSCLVSDADFAVYSGVIGDFASHLPATCTTAGAPSVSLPLPGSDVYYLIVPQNGFTEGSYGSNSAGIARSASAVACLTQAVGVCP
jgi:uncharacterized repeat protein (TIGR01451 family)